MKTSKRIALLAVTLTLSTSAQANFLKDLMDKFQSINKTEKSECAKMDNDEVAALCVEEVCGDATKYPVILTAETIQNYDLTQNKKKVEEVKKDIEQRKEIIEKNVQYASDDLALVKGIKDPSQLSDEAAEKIIHSIVSNIKEHHSLLQKVNPFKSKDKKIKLIVPPNSPFREVYKDVISKIDLNDHPLLIQNLGIKGSPEHYKIYDEKEELFKKELKSRNLTTDYPFEDEREELEEKKKKKDYNLYAFYYPLRRAAQKAGIELEPKLCDDNCKKAIISYLQKSEFFNPQEIAKKAQDKFAFEDAIAECSASAMLNHVEAKDSAEIQKEWPKLIKKLENDSRLKLSAHSKGLILEKVKKDLNVKFNVPVNARNNLYASFSGFEYSPAAKDDIGAAYLNLSRKSAQKIFQESVQTPRCVKLEKTAGLSDHVAFKPQENKGDLVVSPFSCEHVHLGKEIMAHELGHAVSYFIAFTPDMSTETKEGFKALRECSRQEKRTTKFPGLFSPHEGDKWTTEEDTADLFAYALSEDKENMIGCALAVPDGKDYTALGMKKSFFDTHSSGIQRLMVELQYKNPGKITEACEEVIKRSKSKITKQCL